MWWALPTLQLHFMTTLTDLLTASAYNSYSYAYPHKTAYRPLKPPIATLTPEVITEGASGAIDLATVWAQERKEALFLYLHIPFCEMRCGFCNLFTQTNAGEDLVTAYLNTLAREAKQVKAALGESQFARMAIGGGTPTFLNEQELERLFEIVTNIMGAKSLEIPISVEVSPPTATCGKLELLKRWGVDRVSIGIQSFIPAETAAAGRPQAIEEVYSALECIKSVGFPTLNLDLIYGLPGQSIETWIKSLQIALTFAPEELYLYPLYIRPLTGLGRSKREWGDERRDYYRQARELLIVAGYEQVSMRMFRLKSAPSLDAPVYCCQADGMVGLGCGARSYTSALHYSSEYAVGMTGVQEIVAKYIDRSDESFRSIDYGYWLNLDDRQRRFLIQSLLQSEGLSFSDYRRDFGSEALADFPQLHDLLTLELAEQSGDKLLLNPLGIEVSDTIGVWLYSPQVQELMEDYAWR
jgi:oxygen-independent coproporphyrinogen III oxidase